MLRIYPLPDTHAVLFGKNASVAYPPVASYATAFCQQGASQLAIQFHVIARRIGRRVNQDFPPSRSPAERRLTVNAASFSPPAYRHNGPGFSVVQRVLSHCWHASCDCGSHTTSQPAGRRARRWQRLIDAAHLQDVTVLRIIEGITEFHTQLLYHGHVRLKRVVSGCQSSISACVSPPRQQASLSANPT